LSASTEIGQAQKTLVAMVCVVSDTAMGQEDKLVIHLRFALRQGWTKEEPKECIFHLTRYIGRPLVRGVMLKVQVMFAEMRADGGV